MSSDLPAERRVWTRYAANRKTVNMSEGDTEEVSWVARMQNLSRNGVSLIFRRPLELGTKLTVEFLVHGRESPIQLQVHVVRAEQKPDGNWHLGCELVQELSEEELQVLLKPPS